MTQGASKAEYFYYKYYMYMNFDMDQQYRIAQLISAADRLRGGAPGCSR